MTLSRSHGSRQAGPDTKMGSVGSLHGHPKGRDVQRAWAPGDSSLSSLFLSASRHFFQSHTGNPWVLLFITFQETSVWFSHFPLPLSLLPLPLSPLSPSPRPALHPCSHSEAPPGLPLLEASSFRALFPLLDAWHASQTASALWAAVAMAPGAYSAVGEGLSQPKAEALLWGGVWSPLSPPHLACPTASCSSPEDVRLIIHPFPACGCTIGFSP